MHLYRSRLELRLALVFLLAAGCSGSGPQNKKEEGGGAAVKSSAVSLSGKAPAENDVLVMRYGDDPDTLNPILSNDTVSEAFQRHVVESLADRSFSNPDEFEPRLAEKWEFDPKTLTYTIHLRQGVYWHPMTLPNGKELPRTEFTSKDVTFSLDCILNENTEAATTRSYYENPKAKDASEKYKIKVQAIDKYTVSVQWTEPYFLATEFTLGVNVIPRHVYGMDENGEPITRDFRNSKEFAEAFNNHWANRSMCGTGPLIFKDWKKEQQARLVRNPDYWGKPFYFSEVIFKYISNENSALEDAMQNELDSSSIPDKDLYAQARNRPEVKANKVRLEAYDYPAYRYLGFNLKRDIFEDVAVRRAVAHAIPIDEIIKNVYLGLATRLTGPFLPGSSANNSSLKPIPYDLDKARAILAEAGWKDTNGDGVVDKVINGRKVEGRFDLMIVVDSATYSRVAQIIQDNCRKIGLGVQITPVKWQLMLQKLRKKEFDTCILGWALSWKSDPYQIWHGSQADLPESSNSIGYNNPKVNELIETLRVTMDESKHPEIFHQIHKHIYDDQPYVFLYMDQATAARHARLENVKVYPIRPCFDAREWWAATPRTR